MLKRLYVHNYKCLVNFEINFDQDISLFLGANGSGKSTVFEVLSKLRRIIVDEEKVNNVFVNTDCPRWLEQKNFETHFELDFELEKNSYRYILKLKFRGHNFIEEESLFVDNENVFLYKDNKISYLTYEGRESDQISDVVSIRSLIKRYFLPVPYFDNLFIVKINPYKMVSTINESNAEIKIDFSNFSEWFSHLNEKNRRGVSKFENTMRDVLSGFDYFRIEQAGQAKVLQIDFEDKASNKVISYYLNELSEGQKALIALYTLIYCTPDNSVICIDEPENFLALPEIQPWLNTLRNQCKERNIQALLISHHPSLINFLAAYSGYWFSRKDNHTRIEKITKQDDDGLSLAQLIEMGWIYGD